MDRRYCFLCWYSCKLRSEPNAPWEKRERTVDERVVLVLVVVHHRDHSQQRTKNSLVVMGIRPPIVHRKDSEGPRCQLHCRMHPWHAVAHCTSSPELLLTVDGAQSLSAVAVLEGVEAVLHTKQEAPKKGAQL